MRSITAFFQIAKEYKATVQKYERIDGLLAIAGYILTMVLYYMMGAVYAKQNIYLVYLGNFLLAGLCILCTLFRKQPLSSVGFTKKNLLKSLILGLSLVSVLLIINLVAGISGGYQFNTFSRLLTRFGYYLFVIALVEEIIFRGFIQTRIYGVVKNPTFAIFVGAFMFMTMHIPFQMLLVKMDVLSFVANNYITLLFTFFWHIVFNFLYAKYNSIAGPTIFHTIMNWCNELFVG